MPKSKIIIKSAAEVELLRSACQITKKILDDLQAFVAPGVTTDQINSFVHNAMMEVGAKPATLNYRGFPKSCCTSVNEVVCHGIPSPYHVLAAGDIINVDVTSIKNGFFGDASQMYLVGGEEACTPEAIKLVKITNTALHEGIKAVRPGAYVGDIGANISKYIRSLEGEYGIVRDYTGHGIGRSFHEEPQVVHTDNAGTGPKLKKGMTFTIEPMINLGTADTSLSSIDGWTVRTADNKLSAQWEHTVVVTDDGVEILT